MPRFLPDLATRAVPRYTSYPTADRFTDVVGPVDQRTALLAVPPGAPVSFYVHIPYCHEICWYCACNTGTIGRRERLLDYVAALEAEIDMVSGLLSGQLAAIHFGGGTPNALPAETLVALIDRLKARFGRSTTAPISVELDPRHCDDAYIETLAAAGVSRISLGVQTFAQDVQRRIHRVQPFERVQTIVRAARRHGIATINFDLLYGLPDQTVADVENSVGLSLDLAPDRIAAFGYAHLPGLLRRQRMIDAALLPDAAARFDQSVAIHDLLTGAGYAAIGFDHFARPEDGLAIAARAHRLRRNFQGFTDDRCALLVGLGVSAISQFPSAIIQNEKHVGRYRERIAGGGLAAARGVPCDEDGRRRWALIERFLCDEAVDLTDAASLGDDWRAPIDHLIVRGLVRLDGSRLVLADAGRPYARIVAACFDPARSAGILRAAVV